MKTACLTLRSVFALLACGAALGACAGGGSSPPPAATPHPAPASTRVAVSQAGGLTGPVALPSVAGYGSTLIFGANTAPAGTSLTLGVSRSLPPGIVPLSSARKSGAARVFTSVRRPLRAPPADATALLYFTITPSQGFTLDGVPGFTITAPSAAGPDGSLVLVAFDDPTNGWIEIGGFTVEGTTLTYAGNPPGTFAISFVANVTYGIAVYTTQSAPPTPVADPTGLSFLDPAPRALTVSEPGYQGTFVANPSDPNIISVSPGSSTGTFSISPGLNGAATLYITDSYGVTVPVPVNVDLASAATPEPTPTVITIAPLSVDLYYPPSNDPNFPSSATATVSEPGYSGSFVATDYPGLPCSNYATVVASGAAIEPASFVITATSLGPGGAAVVCDVLFSDANDVEAYMTVRIHPPLKAVVH
jgi:hypothetical protein